ncbi:YegP family protein [Tsuneonella sp. HG222]
MTFEIYRARRGLLLRPQWCWRLRARNGRIVATSGEGYNNRGDAVAMINAIRAEAPSASTKGPR